MITEEMLWKVGKIFKPHSYKGEVSVELDYEPEELDFPGTPFFVLVDGIPVPFIMQSMRAQGSKNQIMKFKEIDSDEDASIIANHSLYVLKKFFEDHFGVTEDELERMENEYEGFDVIDIESGAMVGVVTDTQEGVEYDYLEIRREPDGETVLLPMVDDIIKEIIEPEENENGKIIVEIPEGLLEIN